MTEDEQPKRKGKCWICNDCIHKKGWKESVFAKTVILNSLCGHCDREDKAMLINIRDVIDSLDEKTPNLS